MYDTRREIRAAGGSCRRGHVPFAAMLAALLVLGAVSSAEVFGQASGRSSVAGASTVRMTEDEMRYTLALTRGLMNSFATVEAIGQARNKAMMELELDRQVEALGLAVPKGMYEEADRPTILYLSIYAPNGFKQTAEGRGRTVRGAVLDAISSMMSSPHWVDQKLAANVGRLRIGYDLVVGLEPYIANIAEPFLYSFRPGLDGLIYENGSARSVLVPWEAVRQAWVATYARLDDVEAYEQRPVYGQQELKQTTFRALVQRASMTMSTYQTPAARVLRFRAQMFIDREVGGRSGEPLVLYRVGPLYRSEDLSERLLQSAIDRSIEYLSRAPDRNGIVRDGYDPLRLVWSGSGGLRADQQALCIQAMSRLYQSRKQKWMLQGANLLMDTLLGGMRGVRVEGLDKQLRQTAYVNYEGQSQAAWHAQVLIGVAALQDVSPTEDKKSLIKNLANTLLSVQKSDGSFMLFFGPGTNEALMKEDREDVHGASLNLLALVRAAEILEDASLMERARLSADYLVFKREKALGNEKTEGVPDVHLIEALDSMDRHEVNDAYIAYARQCVAQLLVRQVFDRIRTPADELGGFAQDGMVDTQLTAFSLRGLQAANRMASRVKGLSAERYEKLNLKQMDSVALQAGEHAMAYMLGMQYTPENSFYVEEARVASGGFRHSVYDSRISTVTVATWLLSQAERELVKR